MSIQNIATLGSARLERIAQAPSLGEATKMGFLDAIIDWFRGGVKKATIEALYDSITDLRNADSGAGIQEKLSCFLTLRSLALPAHKQQFEFDLVENPSGSCECRLSLAGKQILHRDDIVDKQDLEFLRQKKESVKVEDFLLNLQDVRDPALKLLHSDDKFLIRQGTIGDCYALATLIGVLSNADAKDKIEKMARITEDGDFQLSFKPNLDEVPSRIAGGVLREMLSSEKEAAVMKMKGYKIEVKEDELQVSISSTKLKGILGDTRSAQTNCLIVNILEHFVGNLLAQPDGHLRSRRDSLTSHNTRTGNYDRLVGNLLGYKNVSYKSIRSEEKLGQELRRLDASGMCLSSDNPSGFVYVAMQYGEADSHGKIHERHALVLNKVIFDKPCINQDESVINKVVAIELVNPWDSDDTERMTLADAAARSTTLSGYMPRPEKVEMAATESYSPDMFTMMRA